LLEFSDRLPIQIVRPPSVMGDSDPYMLGLFKAAKAGWVFLPGSTASRYSMIHVDDAVRAIIHVSQCARVRLSRDPNKPEIDQTGWKRCQVPIAASGPTDASQAWYLTPFAANPGLVHLAQDPPLTFVQTAQVVHDVFRRGEIRIARVPKSLCWLIAAANSSASRVLPYRALMNLDKMREGMAGEWMADSTRLTKGLGFVFPLSLEQRIRQTAESYHEKGWL